MNDGIIIAVAGFLVTLMALVRPIISLNTNITALKISIDQLKDTYSQMNNRLTDHGKDIDKMRETLANHEVRITTLEK